MHRPLGRKSDPAEQPGPHQHGKADKGRRHGGILRHLHPHPRQRRGKGVTLPPYDYFQFVYKAYLKELEANKDVLAPACNYDDIMANKAAGKVSSVLTVEDGVPLEGKMERLEEVLPEGRAPDLLHLEL